MDRLDIDMSIFKDILETREQPFQLSPGRVDAALSSYHARQEDWYTELLTIEARRAPNAEGVQRYLTEKYGPRHCLTGKSPNIP